MAWFLPFEQPLGVARQFEKLDAFFHAGFVRVLEPVDLPLTAGLLGAPLVRQFFKERRINHAVELVHVHSIYPILKPPVFGLVTLDRFLLLPALVGVAGVECVTHPFQHLVVELQPPQQIGELIVQPVVWKLY